MPSNSRAYFPVQCAGLVVLLACGACAGSHHSAPPAAGNTPLLRFAVSGDSRNCGNLVMPAIAAGAKADGAQFYWHLGDLRKSYAIDEDFLLEQRFSAPGDVPTKADYAALAIPDFIDHQLRAFGDMPFFVGIGNHETIPPSSRLQFRAQLRELLDRPELRTQREADGLPVAALAPGALPPTYYHWRRGAIDFIYLDNASDNAFDPDQLNWFDEILRRDMADPRVRTLVVGMHEALPHSLGDFHSMCASSAGIASGEHVYRELAVAQNAGRNVYVLASHSHFYLANIYDTDYWRAPEHGGTVLKGWIVGTAGAVRYSLPDGAPAGPGARTLVYGYLTGTIAEDSSIEFRFHELDEAALRYNRPEDLDEAVVPLCLEQNPAPETIAQSQPPASCSSER